MIRRGTPSNPPKKSAPVPSVARGIGIYVRKSTEQQGDLSLPAQERIIRAAIVEPSGQPVYRVYRDVLSGTRADRSGYQHMLTDARAGRLTMVAFHKVNRFGRDAAEGLAAVNELRKLGVEVRVADLPTLDIRKPEGMFVFSFLLIQGQYEVENLGKEAIKGMQELALRGGWPFRAPDGYLNCREHIGSHQRRCWIAVNRKRAAVIRYVFRAYASGRFTLQSLSDHMSRLHEQRVAVGKSGCLRQSGAPWSIQTVRAVLRNRFYLGEVAIPTWDLHLQGVHQPLVSQALFDQVQTIMKQHSQGWLERRIYLLQGRVTMLLDTGERVLLLCSTATSKGIRPYYYRQAKRRRQYIPAHVIEQPVVEAIVSRIAQLGDDPEIAVTAKITSVIRRAQQRVTQQEHTLMNQRKRVLHFGATGRFTDAEIAGELLRLDQELDMLTREQERVATMLAQQDVLIQQWESMIHQIQEWETHDIEVRRHIVTEVIDRVDVSPEGCIIELHWSPIWDLLLHPDN